MENLETKGSILVIDDELGIREGCRRALTPQGYDVQTASSIKDGLQLVQDADFDLVLLDIMMPDGRGIELLEPIHEKDADIVCVIITGFATVELAVNAIKHGAYNFISKPFASDTLIMTVNQGLEKRRLSLETKRLHKIEGHAAELVRAKEEMERLDKFKSDFMLMVAHELRSPVVGAQSLLRTILRGLAGDLNEQQVELLSRVNLRLDMLLELINDLLSLAAGKSIEPDQSLELIFVKPIIQHVVDNFSVQAEDKQVSLTFDPTETPIAVLATEDGLSTVFNNLISNAIKYTPKDGTVQVRLEELDETALITISDSGIGIPQEDIPKLWEEFFRASNVRNSEIIGTGLGLSIVKQLVERFSGLIEVFSVEGEGTKFILTMPLDSTTSNAQVS